RGGLKLAAALDQFHIAVEDRVCLDVGSSTGGFTDCLLQHGARRVHAVDVGAGQLDWKLRNDARVVVHEGINARYLQADQIGEPHSGGGRVQRVSPLCPILGRWASSPSPAPPPPPGWFRSCWSGWNAGTFVCASTRPPPPTRIAPPACRASRCRRAATW